MGPIIRMANLGSQQDSTKKKIEKLVNIDELVFNVGEEDITKEIYIERQGISHQ